MKNLKKLNPWYVTGFCDAESCFKVVVFKSKTVKLGWAVRVEFAIELHLKDKALLEQIQCFFDGVGTIRNIAVRGTVVYTVTKIKDIITVIVPHFLKNPLLTQKRSDFELFKWVVQLMDKKEHLSLDGLIKILAIKASLNKGLPLEIKKAFAMYKITPVIRPEFEFLGFENPY
jgi:hypothetical protein